MASLCLLINLTLLHLMSLTQPAAAQTLVRGANPGALTGGLPFLQGRRAEKLGLAVLSVPHEYVGINLLRRSYMTKNRETVKNYLRGFTDSVRLMRADKVSTFAVSAQVLKIADRDSPEYSYRIMKADARPGLLPTEKAIVNVLKTRPSARSRRSNCFDLSLIQGLKSEAR